MPDMIVPSVEAGAAPEIAASKTVHSSPPTPSTSDIDHNMFGELTKP
jgi:hypothetical protein